MKECMKISNEFAKNDRSRIMKYNKKKNMTRQTISSINYQIEPKHKNYVFNKNYNYQLLAYL